ncbi:MAG TPA: hypothetical protein VLG46_13610 [Anaerolineae bacterium]|nr:hypothetical protein [Anaerolineae bacterium]
MRVTEKDDKLILRTSWLSLFGSVLLSLIFIGVACVTFWAFARDTALTCTRLEAAELRCQLKQTWLGQVVKQVELANPQKAIVQSQRGSKGGTRYRMALVTARGTIPLTDFYSSTRVDNLVDQFNRFIASPTASSVSIDQPVEGFVTVFLVFFGGFGVVFTLTIHYDTFTFDRYQDTLTFTRLGFRGRRTREEALTGLKTEVHQHRGSKGRRFYRVHLVLATGDEIKVDWNASREAAAQDVAARIQEFIRPGTHIKYANA